MEERSQSKFISIDDRENSSLLSFLQNFKSLFFFFLNIKNIVILQSDNNHCYIIIAGPAEDQTESEVVERNERSLDEEKTELEERNEDDEEVEVDERSPSKFFSIDT